MLRHASIILFASAAALWSAGDLFAQSPGGFSGAMLSGSGGGGLGGGSGTSFGSSGSFGSTTGGMGAAGSTTGGLSMMNAANLSGGFGILGFGSQNGFGSGAGQSMYGGRAYGSVTSAGGTSMTNTNRPTSSTSSSASTTGGRGGQSGSSSSRRRTSSTSGSGAAKQQQVWFEPRMEVGFEVPPAQKSEVVSHVITSLGSDKVGSRFGSVQVSVDGETATLRGAVVSQNDRLLAEQIALLEPSILSVRNELAVRKASAPPPASPPASAVRP